MKKALFYWFSFLLLLLFLTSCRGYKPAVITEKTIEKTTETLHDTVFKTEADTSSYKANLGCDPHGNVVIKQVIQTVPGKHVSVPTVKLKDNVLTVDCEARAQELFAFWKSKQSVKTEVIEKPVFIEHQMTFWEELQIWTGRILFGLLVLIIIIWLIKKLLSAYRLNN